MKGAHEKIPDYSLLDRSCHWRQWMRWQSPGGQRQGSASGRYAGLIESDRPFAIGSPVLREWLRAAASCCGLPPFLCVFDRPLPLVVEMHEKAPLKYVRNFNSGSVQTR